MDYSIKVVVTTVRHRLFFPGLRTFLKNVEAVGTITHSPIRSYIISLNP